MGINTIYSETRNTRTISKVRITEDRDAREAWEHHCGVCDRLDVGLSEGDARDELDNHVCEVPVG